AVCETDYLMKVTGTETYQFPRGKNVQLNEQKTAYEIQYHTKIVGQVDGGLGLKNGYTRAAEGSYVAVAKRDGQRVVATMLGVDNNSRQAAVDLLEWDFAQKDPKSLQTVAVGLRATAEEDPTASGSSSDAGGAVEDASPAVTSEESSETETTSLPARALAAALDNPLALGLLAAGTVLLILTAVFWTRLRRRMGR